MPPTKFYEGVCIVIAFHSICKYFILQVKFQNIFELVVWQFYYCDEVTLNKLRLWNLFSSDLKNLTKSEQ